MTQEFATPQDALAHYGKKGMKWGVRNKPTRAEIKDARYNVASDNAKFYKGKSKIKRGEGTRKEKRAAIKKLRASHLKNPDRLTSLRMTNGEKAAFAVLAVAAPPLAVGIAADRVVAKRILTKAAKS
jgi:hypothetical protein